MSFCIHRKWFVPILSVSLTCCAVVDRFGSRITDSNFSSQYAMSQEILLNIIIASRYQALNFVALTQVAGTQTETLNTGLPTVTLGPGQTVMQKQAVFGANSLSSAVQGSFQSNPLVSSAFQDGMLSPMTLRTLALLVASHPREPVLYGVMDSIRIRTTDGTSFTFRNDPTDDLDEHHHFDDRCQERARASATNKALFFMDRICGFSKFVLLLHELLDLGFKAELVPCDPNVPAVGCKSPKTTPPGGGSSTQNAASPQESAGRICFDPSLSLSSYRAHVPNPLCGAKSTVKATPANYTFDYLGTLQLEPVLRSPNAVFTYLGTILREKTQDRVVFLTRDAEKLGRFLEIVESSDTGCFVSAVYDGQSYCVPQNAFATAMLLEILEQLRNLSITPSDLNASFSVRVVD
jgi:hypothetical protein